jgi:D-alanyl-D-alanine carboxypeptidase
MRGPVLHARVGYRGRYEGSTYFSPSYGISKGLLMTSTIGDVIKSAKALGSGALVSPNAFRQRVAPITADLPADPPLPLAFSDDYYYGLGVLVANGWEVQNPNQNGWTSIMAVLPRAGSPSR